MHISLYTITFVDSEFEYQGNSKQSYVTDTDLLLDISNNSGKYNSIK
jgi:hypothetical protein